ncbi:MAG TPA: hypothetical protein VHL78_11440, partial [Actinomycetota bacterium]|nr:hypothetical protein [Actinomycetota bacterium]
MSRARARPDRRRGIGLRLRITIAFLGGALAVSTLVAGTTYVLAERYLSRQRVDDSVEQAFDSLRDALRYLAQPEEEISLNELIRTLEAHGGEALVMNGDTPFSTSLDVT